MTDDVRTLAQDSTSFDVGSIVTGKITRIETNAAYIDFGAKTEGIISLREVSPLKLTDINQVIHVGQDVLAMLTGYDADEQPQLSRRLAGTRMWELLQDKHRDGETFEIVVHDVVNGGLVTDVGVRGFIPASLIDVHRVEDLERFRGETLPVRIVEINPEANKLVLSRKAVLQEEAKTASFQQLGTLHEGDVVKGIVRRVVDFGVFVDVGGVEGLVHVSELSWSRVKNPIEVAHVGDEVTVQVLKVDREKNKLSLSIRQAGSNPWTSLAETIKEGDKLSGVVTRVTDFGAFVELQAGIEGLVHISELSSQRVHHPKDVVQPGQEVQIRVLSIDVKNKRLSLSMNMDSENVAPADVKRYIESAKSEPGMGVTLGDVFGEVFRKLKS